jgi:hypothetical protein
LACRTYATYHTNMSRENFKKKSQKIAKTPEFTGYFEFRYRN